MSQSWSTCRFCKLAEDSSNLLKYGVRHYAHPNCLIAHRGPAIFQTLPLYPLQKPELRRAAIAAGCLAELEAAIRAIEKNALDALSSRGTR